MEGFLNSENSIESDVALEDLLERKNILKEQGRGLLLTLFKGNQCSKAFQIKHWILGSTFLCRINERCLAQLLESRLHDHLLLR